MNRLYSCLHSSYAWTIWTWSTEELELMWPFLHQTFSHQITVFWWENCYFSNKTIVSMCFRSTSKLLEKKKKTLFYHRDARVIIWFIGATGESRKVWLILSLCNQIADVCKISMHFSEVTKISVLFCSAEITGACFNILIITNFH